MSARILATAAAAVLVSALLPVVPVLATTPAGPLPPVLTPQDDSSAASQTQGTLPSAALSTDESVSVSSTGQSAAAGNQASGKPGWGPNTRTSANSDGTYTTQIYDGRVNYKDTTGNWQPIDPTLIASTSGDYTMASKANDLGLAVSDKHAATALAKLKVGSYTVKLRVPGFGDASASPIKPVSGGSSAGSAASASPSSNPVVAIGAGGGVVFPGAGNTGTVFLNPTADGFEFGAIMASASSSSTYSFALDTGGLNAALDGDGVSVDMVDATAAGSPLDVQIGAPIAVDAAGLSSNPGDVHTYVVHPGDKTYPAGVPAATVAALAKSEVLLVYVIDPSWLSAAGRTYPVTLDPTFTTCLGGSTCQKVGYYDSNIDKGKGGSWSGAGLIRAGLDGRGNGLGLLRTMLIFGHVNLVPTVGPFGSGVNVTSAGLWVNQVSNYDSGTMGVRAGRMTTSWTPYDVSWAKTSGTAVMSSNDSKTTTCGHGTGQNCGITVPVQDIVSSWYTANTAVKTTDYGFMLESLNETKLEIDFTSGTTGTNSALFPELSITYKMPTVTVNGTQGAWTNNRTLSWNYSADAGGPQTGAYVEVSTTPSFSTLAWNSGAISGSGTSTTIPGSVSLNDGQTYYWRVVATDGTAVSAPSASGSFKWDGSAVTTVSPAAGAWTSSRLLDWNFADPRGMTQTQYSVVVATNSSFTSPIVSTGITNGVNTEYAIPGTVALTNGTTYYWEVAGYNSAAWSLWGTGSFRWDGTAPSWNGFTAPAAQVDQSAATYPFAWNAATTGGAAISSYAVQLQSAPISASANTCSSAWANIGNPATVTSPTYSATWLTNATCYRVGVLAADTAGNTSSIYYSNPVLIDSSAPSAPVVVDDATAIANPYSSNYTIYFRPAGPGTITLTSKVADSVSDIAYSTFGALSAPTGWTYTAGTVTGNSASKTIAWTATATQTTLAVTTTNKAGLVSPPTTITFVPLPVLTGATGDFATPDEGTTSIIAPTAAFSVAWVETQGTGPITGRSLQRQVQAAGSDGLCSGASWANDGTPTTTATPLAISGGTLTADSCYRWVLTLTDATGSNTFNSGAVEVDGTSPAASITYPEAGRALAGSLVVSGTGSDAHLSNYVLDYGAGSTPTTWTAFANSTASVATSGPLGQWGTTAIAAGAYTLRLTATDFAGNATTATKVVYLDNTARGDDSYNAKVPFDLGGGWNLGVNVARGEASLERNLFVIPSYGPSQSLSLAYNSALTSTGGMFGTGWSSNLTQYLSLESGFVVWHRPDGGSVPFGQIGGTWTALAGHYETLASITGGYRITKTDQSSLSFDSTGRLSAITDRFGSSLSLAWSTSSATATDASGRATTIAIDSANSRITGVTDSAGRHWGFAYTGTNLTGITDPASKTTTLGYTSSVLTSVSRARTPASGSAQTITWGLAYTAGQVTSVTDPIGGAVSPVASSAFTYGAGTTTVRNLRDASNPGAPVFNTSTYLFDSHGWVTWASDPDGWITTTAYDTNGNATSSSRQVSSSVWATTTQTYDAVGNVLTSTDPMGAVTRSTYDADNDMLTQTGAYGTSYALTTAYVYDQPGGHLCRKVENPTVGLACTGALGGAADENVGTIYTYNANNQVATETDALGIVTAYDYDTNGNQTSVSRNYVSGQADDSTSVTTTFAYDSTTAGKAGLPTSQTVPVTTVSPAVSRTTASTYNALGEVLTQTQPGDSYTPSRGTVNTYDEFGNALTTAQFTPSNATGANTTTTNVYDARNRVTSSTTITNTTPTITTTTTRVFDIAGDVITATKPDGTSTASTYDGLGQLLTDQAAGFNVTTHSYDGLGDELSLVEPAPDNGTTTTTRVFDLDGQTTSETVDTGGTPATTSHVFDLLGRETSSTDPSGLVTTTTYDDMGRVTRTLAGTQITDKSYDKDGRVTSGTAPYASGDTQVVSKSVYDNLGRATSTVTNYIAGSSDPSANLTTLNAYDAAGDKVASLDPAGVDTRTAFDINGGAEQTIVNCTDTNPGTAPGSGWATCTGGTAAAHDGTWNVTSTASTTANQTALTTTSTSVVAGVTTTTTSDGDGRVLESIVDPGTAPHLNLKTEHAYDSAGRQIAIQSPAGVVSVTDYDGQGRVVATIVNCTNANPGALPGTSWASCGGAGAHDGTWNQVTSTSYDDAGNKISETAPNGTVTTYAYDGTGNLVTQVDNWVPAGTDATMNVTTNFYYDADGNRIATASPTASGSYAITRDWYDTSGRLTSEIVNCTSSGTTPDANPATCTGQGTHNAQTNVTTSYSYDAAGNKLSVTAPSPANGATGTATVTTRYAYAANNKLCRVLENASVDLQNLDNPCTDALPTGTPRTTTQNVDTQYGYDSADDLASQTTGAVPGAGVVAGTTTWIYDGQGHVASETDPDGNVDGATDAIRAAHTKTFTYDAAGNTTGETDPDTASGAGPTISYAYDAAGRQCRRVAANPGVVLQTLASPCSTAATGATIDTRYGYDAAGNQTSATDALASRTITSTYDQLNRPLTGSGDQTGDPGTTYTYDFDNPTRTDPSGAYTASLDAYGRQVGLTDPLHSSGNMYAWTYAPSGDVATSSDPTGNTTTNTYDPLGRPTARSTSGGTGCSTCAAYTFTYNNAGNELTRVSTISGDTANGTTTFAYDALDRLTTYTPPTVISPQAYTWNGQPDRASIRTGTTTLTVTFDAAGRPVSDSSSGTYGSDGEGRITAVPGKTMTYDALGRLTQVVAGASTTNYTYDALDRLRTINVGSATNRFRYVGTTDSVAQILDNVALTVLTNHATDLDGTELFDFAPGGSSQVYLGRNDHGDVTWSATTTGAVSARVSYDPYGNVAASSGTTPASRWQGSYYDSTSGFYYVNARWYAPSLGTFLSEDPITHEIMDPASRDEYAYGSGDAVDMTDVSGLCGGPGGECSDVTSGLSTPAPSWGMDVTTGYSLGNVQFWRQKDPSWVDRPIVSYARQEALRAKKKTPCTDSLGKSGCFITALAMALDYLHRSQSPNPLTLDSWLNAQTTKGTNSGFINGKSCALSWNSSAMASRLGIKRITKIGVRIWPNTWAQTLTKHGLFQKIAVQLSQGSPVIAEVAPGNPTHFVVITGWTTWSYSGSITGSKREVSSRRYVRAVKGGRRAHYDGTMGDYLINDPEAKKPGTKLFATYGAIINLYKVRRA